MDEHIILVCAAAEGYLIKKTLLNLKVTSAPLMDTYSCSRKLWKRKAKNDHYILNYKDCIRRPAGMG